MIRAVVFDIGNVVCAFHPERRLLELARRTGLPPDHIRDAIWGSGLDSRAEAGELSPGETQRALLDALDQRIDAAALRAAWSTAFVPDPAVSEIVRKLEVAAFAFTNNGPMFTDCLAHELTAVARLFARVICSWELGARKPERTAFARLCNALDRPPAELLFVDDNFDNTESARSAGLVAVTFRSPGALVKDLVECCPGFPGA